MDFISPGNSPGENTEVGSLPLLQGIFPIQESNWGLLHCRWILYHLSYQESPRILEWVAYSLSRGSSWPRNWTRVSCIEGGFFTSWATREAHYTTMKWSEVKLLSCVRLFETPWTVAHQAPPSMGFSRQEHWSGLPFWLCRNGDFLEISSLRYCII